MSEPSPTPVPVRLLLADDHFIVRSGFAASLELEPDFAVVAEAETGEQAVELFRTVQPDVVLMDVRFPGAFGGIEATAAIRARAREARILMYSTFDHGDDILGALLAGAAGYVLKSAPREEVVQAIRAVGAGEWHVRGEVARRLADRIAGMKAEDPAVQVLQLIILGSNKRQMGVALGLPAGAVDGQVARLFAPLREWTLAGKSLAPAGRAGGPTRSMLNSTHAHPRQSPP